ncbi:hypothetical protein C3B44_00230 [Corynebacterium yudongzhengii]|uniref:Uncharacterized protein n=1 Tax=Corynebacterium yudongzhengii TaxID=2080740 RepID=A0A2U1T567_9CORY|nr:hypothetical protein [Corynebacterium yudongzhengii]AWB80969.1 hypothetical protein C3B44_00230 [Corynebacterium yudongzhengii]PWC01105.1 hypothetical protein DF222_09015 [Corynebacterium yudongzhengii]
MTTAVLSYRLTNEVLERSYTVVDRSGAAVLIDQCAEECRGEGGRRPVGVIPSMTTYLAVALATMMIPTTPTVRRIHRCIDQMSLQQRRIVGLDHDGPIASYSSLHAWLTRRLKPLDSGPDLPARRVSNASHRAMMAARTLEQQEAAAQAKDLLHTVVNLLIAGSIDDKNPVGGVGDVVADETIISLAGPTEGLGSKDDKMRGAAYIGAYYLRDRGSGSVVLGEGAREISKQGFGLGVTALSRVGSKKNLYGIAPVITAIGIDKPSPGSVEALSVALHHHRLNGLDQRKNAPNAELPNMCLDMSYSVRKGFTSMVLRQGYAPVVRYPKNRQTVWASAGHDDEEKQSPGPIQIDGTFYCPAALPLVKGRRLVGRLKDLLDAPDGFEAHDQALQKLFPLMMGTNTRPFASRSKADNPFATKAEIGEVHKIELVCPAVQGRVKCRLKPDSLLESFDKPEVHPEWEASRFRCCLQTTMKHVYSEEQWKLAAWAMVPGSWEHAIYYEAARSLTEQRFAIMKSQYVTSLQDLTWSARREPLLCLTIGLWVAATNIAIQGAHARNPRRPNSMDLRFRQLESYLGRSPMKTPPRT